MIERINIRHHAVEQFALTIARQSGRGEGQQFAEGVNAQMLQHAESRVVTYQTFKITPGSTGDCGTTHARSGVAYS